MGIPVELWRARIGSFRCRGSTPRGGGGQYAAGIATRLAAAYYSRHSKALVPATLTGPQCGAIFLLQVIVNGTCVLLRIVSRDHLARIFKMGATQTKGAGGIVQLTAWLLSGGGGARFVLVTA